MSSFNGAAAMSPRKTLICSSQSIQTGKLQWGRGDVAAEDDGGIGLGAASTARLQWGRGDVAAEDPTPPLNDAGTDKQLQWGRGDVAAEDWPPPPRSSGCCRCFNGAAAMSPRKTAPGVAKSRRRVTASMGPRRCRRGRLANSTRGLWGRLELQWGRGDVAAEDAQQQADLTGGRCFNGAAAMSPRKTCAPTPSGRRSGGGFNGAAAMSPRKTTNAAAAETPAGLQWGRGDVAAEDTRGGIASATRCRGFNGAAAMSPRKTCLAIGRRVPGSSFNGAAAMSPRKTRILSFAHPGSSCFNGAAAMSPRKTSAAVMTHASMGQRRCRRGRRRLSACLIASMGPRRCRRGRRPASRLLAA